MNSIEVIKSKGERIDLGEFSRANRKKPPRNKAINILVIPKKIIEPLVLEPNLCCATNPPAPWQKGIELNRNVIELIKSKLKVSFLAESFTVGNNSLEIIITNNMEFKNVKGI